MKGNPDFKKLHKFIFQVNEKTFKVKGSHQPLIKRPDKKVFVDTVVFSAIVSKKLIYDEDFENVKKIIKKQLSQYWDNRFTYIKISKAELEYPGKNKK